MNKEADQPKGPDSQEQEVPKIGQEKLQEILAQHKRWVESEGKEGARAYLVGANLQGADLSQANLQKAVLSGANLQKADLINANLYKADLSGANLQDADLSEANLQGAALFRTNLQDADLSEANLQKAELIEANLQGANLILANLQEANLYRAQLSKATFLSTNLREANLQNATLEDASGLQARQLAGANVSGAKLPPDIHKFEGLTIVEEASKNTRKIFLAMLLGCAYSALTIFSTKDAELLTNSASSPLPIIGTPIPIAGFFGVAPVILFAIYLYFHFYLQRLWEGLADLPAIFPDGRPLDKRAYPWLLNGLVRSHFLHLKQDRPPLSRLQNLVSILLAWWVVPFTITLFWLRYLPRHEWVGTGFHMAFLAFAIVCAVWFRRLARMTLRGQLPEPIRFEGNWRRVKPYKEAFKRIYKLVAVGVIVLLLVFGVSYGAIEGRAETFVRGTASCWFIRFIPNEYQKALPLTELKALVPRLLPCIGARAFADLTEQDVSTKPANWFTGDKELTEIVSGARLKGADLRHATAIRAFLVKADLRGAQLQEANLPEAFLQGADLSEARLQRANLMEAKLQGADLRGTNLQGAMLWGAKLQGAKLAGANLQEAGLRDANLQGAELAQANLQEAFLLLANLQEAFLLLANLQGADLRRANLQGADLRRANLQGADLSGANLTKANLQEADLREVIGLTQEQLDLACGDAETKLPPGMFIKPCPEESN